jgi:hypothetical protein
VQSKEVKTRCNLAEYSKESYGWKGVPDNVDVEDSENDGGGGEMDILNIT